MTVPTRLVVLGAGAIGASVGALLHEQGVPCVLVARGEHGRAMAAHGVELRLPEGSRRVPVPCVASLTEAAPTPSDLVLLATMGQHTEQAVAELDPAVPVASFQNGLRPPALLARRGHRTLAAMVYLGAERRGPGQIALPGTPVPGAFLIGRFPALPEQQTDPWADWLAARLREAGLRAASEPVVAPWLRAKLLTNLGGIVVALCDEPPRDVIEAAQQEAVAVWQAASEPFVEVEALLARVGPLQSVPVDGQRRVGGSTRSALARGEPLETEFLHGDIVQAGREHAIPTPVNEALIGLSQQAVAERWAPGGLSAEALRQRCGLTA